MNGLRVLLVDDEKDYRDALEMRLKLRKISTLVAMSGEEALSLLQSNPVDVVVLDVKMPGMGGLAALHEIKKSHPLVEVILLTGHVSVDAAMEGMEMGAFDYLLKPVDFTELFNKIQDAQARKMLQEKKAGRIKCHEENV